MWACSKCGKNSTEKVGIQCCATSQVATDQGSPGWICKACLTNCHTEIPDGYGPAIRECRSNRCTCGCRSQKQDAFNITALPPRALRGH